MGGSLEVAPFTDTSAEPAVRGFLHRPASSIGRALVLTHGAGSNCQAPLLVALARAFCDAGWTVLRCDLPFRQIRPHGPPRPGDAARDRDGLRRAVAVLRAQCPGPIFLGGHSYGGRQATLLAADAPELVDGLLLLSYPLHPPRRPEQLRTQHLPQLRTPALFFHGTRDGFGSIEEMEGALALVPAKKQLLPVEGAGHDLGFRGKAQPSALAEKIVAAFATFIA
jgi:hypothetical protein